MSFLKLEFRIWSGWHGRPARAVRTLAGRKEVTIDPAAAAQSKWDVLPHSTRRVAARHRRVACATQRLRILTICFIFAATVCLAAAPLKIGDAFPDFAKFKLEGKLPDDLKGKVVLIDFWASWCPPCKKSFPALNELHQRYGTNGLVIIAVNVDEKRADMEAFLKKIPATFTVVRDAEQKLVETVGVEGLPTSFLLDATGRVRFLHNKGYGGDGTKKEYAREIESLLKAP